MTNSTKTPKTDAANANLEAATANYATLCAALDAVVAAEDKIETEIDRLQQKANRIGRGSRGPATDRAIDAIGETLDALFARSLSIGEEKKTLVRAIDEANDARNSAASMLDFARTEDRLGRELTIFEIFGIED